MDEEKNLNVEKPSCPLIGQDGNIFNLVGIAARTLREAGLRDRAKELTHRIFSGECHSYGEALCPDWGICDDHRHWRLQSQPPRKGEG